jgi:hypothetical protein
MFRGLLSIPHCKYPIYIHGQDLELVRLLQHVYVFRGDVYGMSGHAMNVASLGSNDETLPPEKATLWVELVELVRG